MPEQPSIQAPYDQVQDELKAEFRKSIQKLSTSYATAVVTCSVEAVINPKNYGDVAQLFHITAYVLKFICKLKSSVASKLKTEDEGEVLTVDEINKAEMLWLQEIQKSIVNSQKFSQLEASLRLFVDENGLYRCGGRLRNAPLPSDSKFVLIPEEHYVTELIIRNCHNNVIHNGVKDTLTELRQRYYVCRGRQVVKKFITKCLVCRKLEVKPLPTPSPSDLPEYRLSDDFAFSRCGIDFVGPLFVRDIFPRMQPCTRCT